MYHLLYRRKKDLTPELEAELCRKCQFCCRFMLNTKKMDGQKLEFLTAWGIMLITDGGRVGTLLPHACQQITDEGCKIYETRPFVCKGFKGGDEVKMWRPFCLWYELIPEDERVEMLKSWAPAPTRTVG
ncbi:hypothetical protein LCGC14_0864680 [marine sediment metagenome]|uniref:Zinc/iron-chelating domain-containing protein n=1 Tax=marine sediment metagenome TaxID=412755 RepID=A0A0F9PRW9_9ZZZZ